MKKEKDYFDLLEFVGFDHAAVAPIAGVQAYDDVDNAAGPQSVEDPANLDRLNAYVSQINDHQYINPFYPVHTLWRKLQIIGLNFDLRDITFRGSNNGVCEAPLNQFGGRHGFVNKDGTIGNDDGISNRIPGGLKLVIHWINNNGTYTMTALIQKNLDETPKPVIETAVSEALKPSDRSGKTRKADSAKKDRAEGKKASKMVEGESITKDVAQPHPAIDKALTDRGYKLKKQWKSIDGEHVFHYGKGDHEAQVYRKPFENRWNLTQGNRQKAHGSHVGKLNQVLDKIHGDRAEGKKASKMVEGESSKKTPKCQDCGQSRTLDRSGVCHECRVKNADYDGYTPGELICRLKAIHESVAFVEAESETKTGAHGWPLVPSVRFPGETTLGCPKCKSRDVTLGTRYAARGTGSGGRGRLGDPGSKEYAKCKNCGHTSS